MALDQQGNKITKILIVSDSHGDNFWLELIKKNNYDYIIHAGDHLLGNEINNITSYYVDGNNDWSNKNINIFSINNLNFILVHGDEQKVSNTSSDIIINKFKKIIDEQSPDFIIFGHTHVPFLAKFNKTIILNPGSVSFSRHNFKKCYCELILNDNKICDLRFLED